MQQNECQQQTPTSIFHYFVPLLDVESFISFITPRSKPLSDRDDMVVVCLQRWKKMKMEGGGELFIVFLSFAIYLLYNESYTNRFSFSYTSVHILRIPMITT